MLKSQYRHTLMLAWLVLAVSAGQYPSDTFAAQPIKIGIYDSKPFAFLDDAGKPQGLFIDLLNHIAQQEDWAITYRPGSWNECLTRLANGEIDLLANIAQSAEREKTMDFTADYLILDWATVFKQKGSAIQTILDLQDKTVSVVKNAITTTEFKNLLKQFGITCRLIEKTENSETLRSVHTGEADAAVVLNIYGTLLEENYRIEHTMIVFAPIKLRFATPKNLHRDILASLDRHLTQLKADNASIYYQVLNQWIGGAQKTRFPQWLLWALLIVLLLSLLSVIFNLTLNKQVKRRTAELRAANEHLGQEIAERTRAAAALRESEERLRLSLQAANQGLYDLNVKTGETIVNDEYAFMLGYDPKTFVETNTFWIERLHPADQEIMAKAYSDYIEGRTPEYKVEFRQKTKDGQWKWILSLGKIIVYDADGKPLRMLGTHTDITARKQAEEQIRLSEASLKAANAQLNMAQHIASIGSWTHNPDNAMPEWSDEMFRIFGIDPQHGVPAYPEFRGLIHPDQHSRLDDAVNAILTTGLGYSLELGITRPDGCERIIHLQNVAIFHDKDQISYTLGTAQDITERKRAEDEIRKLNAELEQRVRDRTAKLEAVNKELEAFSYSVSHDLRAPLRHISGFVELLREHALPSFDEKSQHYLTVIIKAARQMNQLIDDLLSFSRMGRAEMMQTRVNMGQLCQEAIRQTQQDAAGREIVWSVGQLPDVTGDPAMLKLALVNLLSNAIKFTQTRPQAVIEIGHLPDNAAEDVFYVKDNGVGFNMKYIDKLFGLFQRLHRADEFEGTGVGLANVRRIIQRHGGRIWAESVVDRGATFYCALPKVTAS